MSEAHEAMLEANGWIDRGQWRRARAALERGLRLAPDDCDLLYAQARLDFLTDSGDARDSVLEVLALDPTHADARLLLARIDAAHGRPAEAERLLLELLSEYPQDAALLCHYALLMLRTGFAGKARALAREAIRQAPESLFVLSTTALLDLSDGRRPSDMAALEKMLDLYPEAEETLRMLAFSLLGRMQLKAAREAAALLVRRSPHDPEIVQLAANIAYYGHWSMRPMYPMLRWGWAGSFGLYGGFVALMFVGGALLPPRILQFVFLGWLGYAIYSWVYPPLLRRARFAELK